MKKLTFSTLLTLVIATNAWALGDPVLDVCKGEVVKSYLPQCYTIMPDYKGDYLAHTLIGTNMDGEQISFSQKGELWEVTLTCGMSGGAVDYVLTKRILDSDGQEVDCKIIDIKNQYEE
ncbi:MAG: hypothetical protein HOE90_02370 [Bacteriovoracaceae bacterium]|nr:hypothetical protein [Bacteriovoracaceae bacterium]